MSADAKKEGLTPAAKVFWSAIALAGGAWAIFYVFGIFAATVWNEGIAKFASASGGHLGHVSTSSAAAVLIGFLALVKLISIMWGKSNQAPPTVNVINVPARPKKQETDDER